MKLLDECPTCGSGVDTPCLDKSFGFSMEVATHSARIVADVPKLNTELEYCISLLRRCSAWKHNEQTDKAIADFLEAAR